METTSVLATTLPDGIAISSESERDEVHAIAEALRRNSPGRTKRLRLVVEGDAEEVELCLPPSLVEILGEVAELLDDGTSVTVLPLEEDLTTTQAAEVLDVSRQYLQRLLDEKAIPYHKVGTHHRIKARDILAYRRAREEARDRALTDIVRLGEELRSNE